MSLPASGQIDMGQVRQLLGYSSVASISLNDTQVRILFNKPSGQISLADGHSAPVVTGGSANYVTVYFSTFTVPNYSTLTVRVLGAGGTGDGSGTAGGTSSFGNLLYAYGGGGGAVGEVSTDGKTGTTYYFGNPGSPASGTGGTVTVGGGLPGAYSSDGLIGSGGAGGLVVQTYTLGGNPSLPLGASYTISAYGAVYITWS